MPTIEESTDAVIEQGDSKRRLRQQFQIEQDQIYSAIGYLVMAGIAYPGILLLITCVVNVITYGVSFEDLPFAVVLYVMITLAGAAIGFAIVGFFAAFCAVSMVFFHYTTRCRFHPSTLVHFLGGMVGFWAAMFLPSLEVGVGYSDWEFVLFAAVLGMVLGQSVTTVGYCRKYGQYERQGEHSDLQFGILDMFIVMTWFAAGMAFFRFLSPSAFKVAGVWIAIQIPLSLVSGACYRYYRKMPFRARKENSPEPKSMRAISVRATFLLLTAVGVVCVIEPLMGLAIFAFSPAIFGMLLIRNGLIKKNDTLSNQGIACVAFGFVAGALLLAGFAQLFGL